ncbi:hypothetical protein BJD99_18355 [Rhodococcus sp. 1163]|nr:hypothetical protein BJD99_18355 [Rhodococcus sp. 1163]
MRHYEIAGFTLDRAQELEAEKTWRTFDSAGAGSETLLQFRACTLGNFDCIYLHDSHDREATRSCGELQS